MMFEDVYKRQVEVHGTALDDALYKCVLGGCREDVYHLEDVVEPFDIADGRKMCIRDSSTSYAVAAAVSAKTVSANTNMSADRAAAAMSSP